MFIRNGILLATQPVSGNQVSAGFTDASTAGKAYYYVMVKENDDNDKNGRNDEACFTHLDRIKGESRPVRLSGVSAGKT